MSRIAADRPAGYFERLRELFDRLADLPTDEREREIVRAADGDATLEEELRGLLEHSDRAETTFDNSTLLVSKWSEPPLPVIPGFRVHRRIGRGGSATVYLADQERADFTRPVALKVVDYTMDAASLTRVREEQRILARLEHCGIARLYDTGTTSLGHPYLAMEHVEGVTIVEHCRTRQLPIRARIELFLSVLDAVSYAHDHAIVHRDLKPANILVSARGEAKLLDFGIAKLAGGDDATLTLQRAMTPAYASPEQIRGRRITPASDIYSLGVVLYELLANTIPFRLDERALGKTDEPIPDHEPEPPSATFEGDVAMSRSDVARWRKTLRGDLDAVVLTALRHNPEARYSSAAAFADDLRLVLAGRPVAARRGDRIYRTGKFLRRHRVAFAAIAAALVVALLFVAVRERTNPSRPNELAIFYETGNRSLRDGAQQLERFEAAAARDSFRWAAADSRGHMPDELLAWDGVARAESALGEVGRAAEAAKRAGDLIASAGTTLPGDALSDDELTRMRAAALAANHDWATAIPMLDGLFVRQPERADVGMALVSTLLAAGRTEAADTVLGRLRQVSVDSGGDPRIDLVEAELAHQFSEYQRAVAAATRARDRAQKLGATALGLRAERIRAEAIGRLDQREDARRALESLAKRADAAGLVREAAQTRLELASVLSRIASQEETDRLAETALAGLRAAGDVRGQIMARALLATQAAKRGEFKKAIPEADAALADARRIGDRWAEGGVQSYRLPILNWADEEAALEASIEPALSALRDSGNRQSLMSILGNHALVAIGKLDLDRAEAYLLEAEALGPRVGSQLASASIDRSRGYLEETRGNRDLARQRYLSALEKARRAGVLLTIGRYLSDLAWVEMAANRPDAAEAYVREAISVLEAAGDQRSARATETLLAWIDASRGDAPAARKRLELRRQAVAEDPGGRFSLLGIEARVAGALGDWDRAVDLRRQQVRMATEWELHGLRIQQQAYLAQALHRAGHRRELEKLTAEMLPEVQRLGLHGIERDLRALAADS
jgi:tetratricopeptide (TPR) repeat protein